MNGLFIQKALNNDNNDTDIYSETKGEKYSIIGEGIYEKQFNTVSLPEVSSIHRPICKIDIRVI